MIGADSVITGVVSGSMVGVVGEVGMVGVVVGAGSATAESATFGVSKVDSAELDEY